MDDPRERLKGLTVPTPCTADWRAMRGDDAVRHCATCSQNVFNLEKLPSEKVLELLETRERVCGRFYQRRDGTVITADCAWVWADAKKRARSIVGESYFVQAGAVTVAVVMVLAVGLAAVALFGDNIRKLFGSSATAGAMALPPASTATVTPPRPQARLETFGARDAY